MKVGKLNLKIGDIALPGVYCTHQHHTVDMCEMSRISQQTTHTFQNTFCVSRYL